MTDETRDRLLSCLVKITTIQLSNPCNLNTSCLSNGKRLNGGNRCCCISNLRQQRPSMRNE